MVRPATRYRCFTVYVYNAGELGGISSLGVQFYNRSHKAGRMCRIPMFGQMLSFTSHGAHNAAGLVMCTVANQCLTSTILIGAQLGL